MLALSAACLAGLAAAPAAQAGQYEVQSCMDNYGGSSVWNYFMWGRSFWSALNPVPGCASPGGTGQGSVFTGQPSDLEAEVWGSQGTSGYYLDAPAATTWTYLIWQQRLWGQGGGNRCLTANDSGGNLIGSATCVSNSFSLQDTGWQAKAGATNTSRLYFTMGCLFAACTGGANNRLYGGYGGIGARLTDNSAPALSGLSGVWGKDWVRGSWPLSWDASDSLGVKIHNWQIDGASGGINQFCNPTYYGDGGYFFGSSLQPCPNPGQAGYQSASFTVNTADYSDGQHTLGALSYDTTSNIGSASSAIKIDNSPPSQPVFTSGPASGAWSNDPTPTYAFSAQATSGISGYRCGIDGAPASSCSSAYTLPALTDGSHTFCVAAANNALDISGAPAWGSPSCTIVKIDTVAPAAQMTEPPAWIAAAGTVLRGSASDPTAGLSQVQFQAQRSGSSNWINLCNPPVAGASYTCTVDGSSLVDGAVYSLRLLASNNAGSSGASQIYSSRVDSTGPTAPSVTAGPADQSWQNTTAATYQFAASSSLSGVAAYRCQLNNAAWAACSSPQTFSPLALGENTVSFKAVDVAGNTGPATVTTVGYDNIPPLLAWQQLPAYMSSSSTISAKATDALSGIDASSIKLQFDAGGGFSDVCASPSQAAAIFSCLWNTTTESNGSYSMRVTGQDRAGNSPATWPTASTIIDNSSPVITLTSPDRIAKWLVQDPISGIDALAFEAEFSDDDGASWNSMENAYWDAGADLYHAAIPDSVAGNTAIKVKLAASSRAGVSDQLISSYTLPLAPPVNDVPPLISGIARQGQQLSSTDGQWSGLAPIAVQLSWLRCSAAPAADDCLKLTDSSTYTLLNGDVNHRIKSLAAASNLDGSGSEDSAATEPVDALPPAVISAPALSGTAKDGNSLSATEGSWSGSTPMLFTYQWQRCDQSGDSCSNIADATQDSYVLTSSDVDHALRAEVTADNSALPAGSSASSRSAASLVVQAQQPAALEAPQISGLAYDGRSLSASTGQWSGSTPFVYSYQWLTCDSDGLNCSDYPLATSQTWALPAEMIGRTAKVKVEASNQGLPGGGSAQQTSDASQTVAQAAVSNFALPQMSGTAAEDDLLTVTDGSWRGAPPITFSVQWQRCQADRSSCSDINQAVSSSYTAETADIGLRLRAVVTATNSSSSNTATSAFSEIVEATPDPPVNTAAPQLSGSAEAGSLLSASSGTWTGRAVISYSYQWQLCQAAGSSCADISSADSAAYRLQSTDVGKRVRVVVRAANSDGSDYAQSALSDLITSLAPVNQQAPYVSGAEVEPGSLTAHPGQWAGAGPIDYSYQWQACRAEDCSPAGSSAQLPIAAAQVGAYIQLSVTASNSYGQASSTSIRYGPIEPQALPPTNLKPPTLTGSAMVEGKISTSTGDWQGSAPILFKYAWLRCKTEQFDSCQQLTGPPSVSTALTGSNIFSADSSSYSLTAADRGYRIRSQVEAVNAAGTAVAVSAASSVVGLPACVTIGASSAATIRLRGRKVFLYKRLTATASSSKPFQLRAKSSRSISWAWRLNNASVRSGRSRALSASTSSSRLRLGKNSWSLTVTVGRYKRTINRTSYVLQCPASKVLTPKPKSRLLQLGSWRGRASVSAAYAALKPGVWQLSGKGAPARSWYLDGKKISSRSKVSLSPARLQLGKHKITLRLTKGRVSKSVSWTAAASH